MKLNERRENVQKLRLCFNCLRPGHRSEDCKKRTFSVPNCGRQHNKLLHSNFSKEATTAASDATTAVATMITQGGLPVVRIKLVNEGLRLSVLAMFDTGSSISFVDKSIVSTLQLQGQKTNLSLAGIHGSQDAKTEIVPIAVSAHEKFRPLTTLKFYVHEKLKLGGQIVDLQGFKDRYPHLKNLQNESYNLNEVQVVLGQDCYEIHHPLELKNGPLPAKQAPTLATRAISVSEDKLASQLSRWWDLDSYATNCDVAEQSKEEHRAIKTLKQTARFTGERYEVGLLWREGEVKLPNNFYSAMGQLRSLEQRLQKDVMFRKCYHDTTDTEVKARYVPKVQQIELNETRGKLQLYLPHHPFVNSHKPEKIRKVCKAAAKYQGDKEVNSQIPEADRSTNVLKTFEAEPQSSSILGLSWNVDTDSLIDCRGTEQKIKPQSRKNCWLGKSVAQHSSPSRPLSPNVVINPPENVTQDRDDKRFSTYPKTTPLFQLGAGIFTTQLQDSSILKKPEIPKSIRVTDILPKKAFQ
ncbi:uncharacterized protein LOC142351745 [Convolutriloba macropyga]|uniref:uncharacterized protein LOC142351745 n=1 Tax=Convolutriloba macropyga TaxID=536237 RepID=UPI003F51ED40